MDTKEKAKRPARTASGTRKKSASPEAEPRRRRTSAAPSSAAAPRRTRAAAAAMDTAPGTSRRRKPAAEETAAPGPEVIYTPPKPFNRNRFLLRLATVVAVVLALVFGISLFFRVENVTVSGTDKYTPYMIREAAGIEDGANLLTLSDARISGNILAALPYVDTATVSIQLPNTVHIQITELDVVYSIRDNNDAWWLITAEGKVVEKVDSAAAGTHTSILGVRLQDPAALTQAAAADLVTGGNETGGQGQNQPPQLTSGASRLSAALTIAQYLQENQIIGEAASINVSDLGNIELWYGQRFQVKLGDTTELGYKILCMAGAIKGSGENSLQAHDSGVLDISFSTRPEIIYTPFAD